jgi:hypothetical protein
MGVFTSFMDGKIHIYIYIYFFLPSLGGFVAGDFVFFKWANIKVTVMKEFGLCVL